MPHFSRTGFAVGHVEAQVMSSHTLLGAIVKVGARVESEQPTTWRPVIIDTGATEPLWVGDDVFATFEEANREARTRYHESVRRARVDLFAWEE